MAAGYGVGRSSQKRERFAHDVFLSFRGEDVREGFIDHLRHVLDQKGITVFYDNKGLERGDEIQSKLYEAIESSEIAIVTFSRKFADSRWCLDELVKIMERRGSHDLIVLPVFYKVDPTDVRHQTGTYAEAFPKHDAKYGCERVNKWKQALISAADLAGFRPQPNEYEAQFIQHIVKEVDRKLDARQLDIPKYMVGEKSSLIREINKWLQNGSSQVEIGIIFGPGGVGKTTISKVVYNENYHAFESSSFLAGVRTAHGNDTEFIRLQKQLICNITREEAVSIDNVSQGKQKIKRAIGTKKILVVVDDISEKLELDKIFDYLDWFVPGSKILITTRSQNLLINGKSISRFEACLLDDERSTELFSYHAFEQAYPLQNYEKISMLFIRYCDGLPLALEVLASTLRSIPFEKWKLEFDRLQKSSLVHSWNDSKFMGALQILDLSHSHHLVSTPDLSNAPMLEWIFCEDCINLIKVHKSIGELENLIELNLKGCINLVTLPECIGALNKLTRFTVEGCRNLRNLPISMPRSVESLNLGECSSFFMTFNQVETSTTTGLESRSNIIISATSHYPIPCPLCPLLFNIFLPSLKKLFLANCGISRDDVMELISCAPSLDYVDLSGNPIRVLSNMNRGSCLKLSTLVLEVCPNLQSISNILEGCCLWVEDCDSLKRITFHRKINVIKEQQRQHLIEAKDCEKLVDMEYGVSGDAVIEWTSEMNEDRARYLGFPNLNTFDYPDMDSADFGRGIYQAGMYSVILCGDHMAEWFLPTTTYERVSVVSHRVPSVHPTNERPIRALNLGFLVTRPADDLYMYNCLIENVTRMWKWFYCLPWCTFSLKDEKFTWLTHWYVTEHRQIRPGDLLEIHIDDGCEYIGVKVIYEVGQLDGEGAEKDDEEVRGTCNSVDSSRTRISNQKGKKEGIDDSDTDVAVWYNNIFRSVDLSLHFDGEAGEVKQKTNEENSCDPTAAYIKVYDINIPFWI